MAGTVALVLVGCSTALSGPASPVASNAITRADRANTADRSIESAGPSGSLIYVTGNNQVLIYREHGNNASPVGSISNGIDNPFELYVDSRQRLYVSNDNGTVTAYDRGSTDPIAVYSGLRPYFMTTDKHGDLFVGSGATVVEFLSGTTSPYQTLHIEGTEADGLAFDAEDNLYVAFRRHDGIGSVEKFRRGSALGHALGMRLDQPQGLVVDGHGNIFVAITGHRETIQVFPPGSNISSSHIRIPGDPTEIALTRDQHHFYVTSFPKEELYEGTFPFSGLRAKLHVFPAAMKGVAITNGARL
jgi:hypothetical protein